MNLHFVANDESILKSVKQNKTLVIAFLHLALPTMVSALKKHVVKHKSLME